ncbi:NAD-dependent epimerase/dehydratase family protein [Planktothrix agardhii 1801]|uniref:NAD-dependent epimerase/dehydratase family protein n=1 Tax=Planktothrix agardhii TaxID=1160 RepID=UPI001F2C26B0|nr:NAD-dependent epimerase/dehydratase family protein [Planktothrix agardhii]MCF3623894.1 NAD-dependent epimerase/dehydratase family protein [Planktothrix agardhii 1801]
MKKVLLTGANGFIGRHTIAPLTAAGFEVHAVTSKIPLNSTDVNGKCCWHTMNLLDPMQVKNLVSTVKPTHLLHFAWYNIPGKCLVAEENFLWVQASLELLRHFREQGGERVVMAGSALEYDWNYGYCSEVLTPRNPHTAYGVCKNALQEMLKAYAEITKLSSAWGRVFNVYGPYDHPKRLVSSVILSLLKDEPALCSHGNQLRDYLYVEDLANAFVKLLEGNVTGEINIASGKPVAVKEIIYKIAGKLGKTDLVSLGAIPVSSSEPPLFAANIVRSSEEVSFSPEYDLDKGLDLTIIWWKKRLFDR